MSEAEKQQRLVALRRLHARRELMWRGQDSDDQLGQRPDIDLAGGEPANRRRPATDRRRKTGSSMTSQNLQLTDHGWTDTNTAHAMSIVRACLEAGRPELIEAKLFGASRARRQGQMPTGAAPPPAATPHTQTAVDAWGDVRAAAEAWQRQPQSGVCADATSTVIRAAIALGQSLPPLPRRT
jgi:hypothetical protein